MSMRTILITGVTGKVGQVLARHFLANGDNVIGTSRSQKSLDRLRESFGSETKHFYSVVVDLLGQNAIFELLESLQVLNLFPDCLINNARNSKFLSAELDGSISRLNFINELTLDVIVPYELTFALANRPEGLLRSVVNVGSQYGVVAPNLNLYPDPHRESVLHYGVAKAALVHLTKELAIRLVKNSVRVNCVAFGGIEGRVDEAFRAKYSELCPMKRMLTEDELASPVDMLLSDSSSAITGETLIVDCGWSLW